MNARIAKKRIRGYLAGVRAKQRRTLREYIAALTYLRSHGPRERGRWIPREYRPSTKVWVYRRAPAILPDGPFALTFQWGPPVSVTAPDSPEQALARKILLNLKPAPVVVVG